MKCGRCGLTLPAGSVHVSDEGCIDALREALDRATACAECGGSVPLPLHATCMAKFAARKGSSAAIDEGARRVTDAVTRFFSRKGEEGNR